MKPYLAFLDTVHYETVGRAAERLYPDETFDPALPQDWVNALYNRGFDPIGHFVTLYPKGKPAYIAPITPRGVQIAAVIASAAA